MKHRNKSRLVVIISALMSIAVMCGVTYAGVYTAPSPSQAISDNPPSPTGQNQNNNQAGDINAPAQTVTSAQTVVYENVEMRRYEGEDGHPYIHDIMTNTTDQTINAYTYAMPAFDKDGDPLKIDWWGFFRSTAEPEYLNLNTYDSSSLAAGKTLILIHGLPFMREKNRC